MSVHCVVVWEWASGAQWVPHAPAVSRALERAHDKRLTRVVLADADPELAGHVNLRTLTQCTENHDGSVSECAVRRSCYSVSSAGGRGVRWEWAAVAARGRGALVYEPLPMEAQCRLEEAWARGADPVLLEGGWAASVGALSARGPAAATRLLRRAAQPPYPRVRSAAPHPPQPPQRAPVADDRPTLQGRRAHIPQQHTGSSVQSVQSMQPARSAQAVVGGRGGGARSASPPRERKPGLARQILHNLNIFSHHSPKPPQPPQPPPAVADGGSPRSARRHSVDTVSTYLSHESKESLQRGSAGEAGEMGELLNCSVGSDDVFDPSPADVAMDADSFIKDVVRAVQVVQWGALCPACLRALDAPGPAVALRRCHHMLHLRCMRDHLLLLARAGEPLRMECLVCGELYGADTAVVPAPAPNLGPAPAHEQPPGTLAWAAQPSTLPGHPLGTGSILLTYNFQSGRQGPGHPLPGAPYYAVGFPRHSLVPDTGLGRQVAALVRAAWERRVLFAVTASRTTGREHVLAWRAPPAPPAARDHYACPEDALRLLAAAAQALHALLAAAPRPAPQ